MMPWKHSSRVLSGLIVGTWFFSSSVDANCWRDRDLTARATEVARRHFPRISQLPVVVVCDAENFAPGIGGSFSSGPSPEIRIPVWQLHRSELTAVLGHELAHFQSFIDGTDDGTASGHGMGWMTAMLAAGLLDEAHRVAATVPGAGQALAQLQSQGRDKRRAPRERPPIQIEYVPPQYVNPQVVTCFVEPQQRIFRDRRGRQTVSTVFVEVCHMGH